MSDAARRGFRGHTNPLDLVDRTDVGYGERLATLQDWKAELARSGAPQEEQDALQGAIQALEMGAGLQGDDAGELPEGGGHRRGPNS